MRLQTIILAAGQGTRMRSAQPKVLHQIGGRSLIGHVYRLAQAIGSDDIAIVYGHGGTVMLEACREFDASWIEQAPQLGTGHAVQQARDRIADDHCVLVLYGDVPLLTAETVQTLVADVDERTVALLTVEFADPHGYGRIVRGPDGAVRKIVEERDADESIRTIREVNSGIVAFPGKALKGWLDRLSTTNAQGEYYLTDAIEMAVADGFTVATTLAASASEVMGINNRVQLAEAERIYQARCARTLMEQGVTLRDPARFDLRGDIEKIGEDVEIDVNVVLEGRIRLGDRVRIGANVCLKDCTVGDDTEILPNCYLEHSEIGASSRIGPFSRLRPDTRLEDHVHIGNFVELKKSVVASGSKINHLSYVGDTLVGRRVNIGAGTITCNYDGANKYQTIIEDGVFIGSDTQLIAPVRVAENATIGAGSTITRDVPPDRLTLSRTRQTTVEGWERPRKKEK
ncbi:MAG: bifunctional UDP-N-acetylglucosamine diphosphorylase/glucosamine-1-phosphate N-acetyltransferase GlmU [Methylotetracoccus sp.]